MQSGSTFSSALAPMYPGGEVGIQKVGQPSGNRGQIIPRPFSMEKIVETCEHTMHIVGDAKLMYNRF